MHTRHIYWHKTVNRPIVEADLGRFIVGRSATQWLAGFLVKGQSESGPFVDTEYHRSPGVQYVCANSMCVYAFLNGPWPTGDDQRQDPLGKVLPFR